MDKHTMSDAKRVDDGGAAFPQGDLSGYGMGPSDGPQGGMSLRDWFAGQALAGIAQDHGDPCDGYREAVSRRAYMLADAMLLARKGSTR